MTRTPFAGVTAGAGAREAEGLGDGRAAVGEDSTGDAVVGGSMVWDGDGLGSGAGMAGVAAPAEGLGSAVEEADPPGSEHALSSTRAATSVRARAPGRPPPARRPAVPPYGLLSDS